jgi:ribonuclease HII
MKWMVGIDESGRGPLAGPVAVGAVLVSEGFVVEQEFPGVKDSKLLSEKKREALFTELEHRVELGDLRFKVEMESSETIDSQGIAYAVRTALNRALEFLAPHSDEVLVKLDGSLKAPERYRQETIIDGDALVPIISLASVAAKVVRDREMHVLAKQFPLYGFERHKGYGTSAHYRALTEYGLCSVHRKSFIHLEEQMN